MSKLFSVLCVTSLCVLPAACGEESTQVSATAAMEQANEGKLTLSEAQLACRCQLELVRVGGTVFHFGLDLTRTPPVSYPFQSTVAEAQIWIAELPATRRLNVRANADGKWSIWAIKVKGTPLPVSFVTELAGYPTTKSQRFEIGDGGLTDVAVQLPTAAYYAAAKGQIEQQIGALIGTPYSLRNVLVTTVGKAWASMYSPLLPHGDPGATVAITPATQFPASLGPIYFDETVSPNPTYTSTSVDGGVLFGNLANGSYKLAAIKAPFSYSALTFVVQDGIGLYVASPPHGLQGTNASPPGQP